MQILIIIGSVLAALIVLFLIAGMIIPRQYEVQAEITINRDHNSVFNYVRYLKNQDHYSKWVMTDPGMKKTFRGTDGQVGFVYAWNGNKQAGEGEQEIMGLEEGKYLDIEVRFIRPFQNTGRTPMTLQPADGNNTKVIWGLKGNSPFPLNVMTAMMKGRLRKDLDISLSNLKRILES
jgi:hypothetical protein